MTENHAADTPAKAARKKDRRSVATEAAIKDCLLNRLGASRFGDLTVSEICRDAGITRATFYQHYGNLSDVLDELLDDLTGKLGDVPLEMCESCTGIGGAPGDKRTGGDAPHIWKGIPFCHFYASNNPYRALLEDNTIAERLIERVVDRNLDVMMDSLKRRHPESALDRAQLRYVNIFRMSGCLAAAKAARRNGHDWALVQPTLDAAIAAAFGTLR